MPVLMAEVLEWLVPERCQQVIDATFGRGGHSRALLARMSADARLLAVDRDPLAVAEAQELAREDRRVRVAAGEFSELSALAAAAGFSAVDAVLIDSGVSSPQLDDPERGFSFRADGPLDMRMNTDAELTAAQWLNTADETDMARAFRELGEERFAGRIAHAIVAARPLRRTSELVEVIERAQPRKDPHKHGATRVFQAVRMVVNNEVGELREGIDAAFAQLRPGGRLAVISFHSGDDRLVKRQLRDLSRPPESPRRLPVRDEAPPPARLLTRAVKPSEAEIAANPRSRSAVLRVVEKSA